MTEHKKQLLPDWVLIATAGFAFVAIADLPYGYYRLLRWVACAVAVAWALGLVALVFNPLVPVHFEKATWRVLDAAAGVSFLCVLYFSRKDRGGRRRRRSQRELLIAPNQSKLTTTR